MPNVIFARRARRGRSLRHLPAVLAAGILLAGCGYIAEWAAPKKQATTARTPAAVGADALFWATFHAGDYDHISSALEAETGAYLQNPDDAVTAAHVGWLHIWRLAERQRLAAAPATITDDIALTRRYFQEAVALAPDDARYLSFLASATLAEGSIHHDEKLTRRGYYMMLDAIKAWPEFNLFTAGYVMSRQPATSDRFRQALEWQWQDLDACAGTTVDRKDVSYAGYMKLETHEGPKRVCWNSPIAPHNLEGFFLNMGDMLVKSGDWQTARIMYANAKLSPTFPQWAYRRVLEDRVRDARENVAVFNAPAEPGSHTNKPILIDAPFSCTACHQN